MAKFWYGVFSLLLTACNYERMKGTDTEPLRGTMSFAWLQNNVIGPRCLSCHNGPAGANGVDLAISCEELVNRKLVVPFHPDKSPFFLAIASGDMPRKADPLPPSQVELIRAWIQGGATEGGNWIEPVTPVDPPVNKATYAWLDKNVFQVRCINCHGEVKPKADISFASYEALMESENENRHAVVPGKAADSSLFVQVEDQSMPPGKNKLSDVEIAAIGEWIEHGAQNN